MRRSPDIHRTRSILHGLDGKDVGPPATGSDSPAAGQRCACAPTLGTGVNLGARLPVGGRGLYRRLAAATDSALNQDIHHLQHARFTGLFGSLPSERRTEQASECRRCTCFADNESRSLGKDNLRDLGCLRRPVTWGILDMLTVRLPRVVSQRVRISKKSRRQASGQKHYFRAATRALHTGSRSERV